MDAGQSFSSPDQPVHRHPAVVALIAVVFFEALCLLVATIVSIVEIFLAQPGAVGTTIALAVVVLLLLVGVASLGWGLLLGRKRLLGAVITWQFMQIAICIGLFEGLFGPWWTGLVAVLPAVAGIVLAVIKPVTGLLASPYRSEVEAAEARREAIRQAGKAAGKRR